MFSSFVYLKEYNIVLLTRKKAADFSSDHTTTKKILELVGKNKLFKLILDYRDSNIKLTEKELVTFWKYFKKSTADDAYFAIIVDDVTDIDNCFSNPNSEILQRNCQLKFRLFDDMIYALNWLKTI